MSCQLNSPRLLHRPCPPPRWRLVKTSQVSCLHVISVEPQSLARGVTSISTDFLETKPFVPTRNPKVCTVRVAAVSDLCCRTTRPINSPHGNEPWSMVRHKPSMATQYDMEPSGSEFGDSILLS